MSNELTFTDGSTVREKIVKMHIAKCGLDEWESEPTLEFFDALGALSMHAYQTHMPSTKLGGKTILPEQHEYRYGRDGMCDVCGRQATNPIHYRETR